MEPLLRPGTTYLAKKKQTLHKCSLSPNHPKPQPKKQQTYKKSNVSLPPPAPSPAAGASPPWRSRQEGANHPNTSHPSVSGGPIPSMENTMKRYEADGTWCASYFLMWLQTKNSILHHTNSTPSKWMAWTRYKSPVPYFHLK